jgi:alpha-glucosidase
LDGAAAGEFLLGPDLLVAPPSFPEELDEYQAELPGSGWYDFWTGERVRAHALPLPVTTSVDPPSEKNATQPLAVDVTPRLDELPVFVRSGAILPMAPLIQSTDETPQGPLTLRVYAGAPCTGSLYMDDGKSYAFQQGTYLRMNFGCRITPQGMELEIGAHHGSFPAWWKEIRVEIYGWTPSSGEVLVNGQKVAARRSRGKKEVVFLTADDGNGSKVEFR